MEWRKMGLVYAPGGPSPWRSSHAQSPVADRDSSGTLHLYFASRDDRNRCRIGRIEVDPQHPANVLRVQDQPVLDLGEPGMFDDSGVMPACLIARGREKFLFYTGWNLSTAVPYRLAMGVAVSTDGGATFDRIHEGPILDRSKWSPGFCAAPFVLASGCSWNMWYVSCTHWREVNGRSEPYYHIKRAVSRDGLEWEETGEVVIDYDSRTDAISRPCVFRTDGGFGMLYSYRRADSYRESKERAYRLGYAVSNDLRTWVRKDEQSGLIVSPDGWDSEMIAYPLLHRENGVDYLFYNGNDFGRSGLGYAVARPPGKSFP